MMKTAITCLSLVTIVILCTGCPEDTDPVDSRILIVNNSDEVIVHYDELKNYNDTSLSTIAFPQTPENTKSRAIKGKDSSVQKAGFKRMLQNNPDKVLMLYLFSRDTVEQVPWDSIVSDHKVLRRYGLSLSDLESRGWKVEYP